MPKDTSIQHILILGSGPIIIGQACEFDYSGSQASRAIREEGIKVSLLNDNPATIMTDPMIADHIYLKSLKPETIVEILSSSDIDAVLPTMGGQTALNLAKECSELGIWEKYNVRVLGADLNAIEKTENREEFRQFMMDIGIKICPSKVANSFLEGKSIAQELGFPLVIRPSYTLGGYGGGFVFGPEDFDEKLTRGLEASPTHEVLIEKAVIGWKEYELELLRDSADHVTVVCTVENLDPMGIHTGDSVTVAPAMTLPDTVYQDMRNQAKLMMKELGSFAGGCNIQFSVNPETEEVYSIEMNPRVSRSSALASKATGYPIAKIAAKLAIGYRLDELDNPITGNTSALFEPALDYVIVKMPRWNFDKFKGADATLGLQMKSVGEVMAIGRNFQEALQKACQSLENNRIGLSSPKGVYLKTDKILEGLKNPSWDRIFLVKEAYKLGVPTAKIQELTKIDIWYLKQIQELVQIEESFRGKSMDEVSDEMLFSAKLKGFSDAQLAEAMGNITEDEVYDERHARGIKRVYKVVDTCAGEFKAKTPYFYSSFGLENESEVSEKPKVIILGSGPNRIGQGIEFDYCCVHGVQAVQEAGYEAIMVNCNPETVSTDFDLADKLYFEPIYWEHLREIIDLEKPHGIIVQLGGQTALKLSKRIKDYGVKILGSSYDAMDMAEDRERFSDLLKDLGIPYPKYGAAKTAEEALVVANEVGYPVLVRPSYVLGGQRMKIVINDDELTTAVLKILKYHPDNNILIDHFLVRAKEAEVDAIFDGKNVQIMGIMEHIEPAGIHSGDSNAVLPPFTLGEFVIKQMEKFTAEIAKALDVRGLLNVQFAIKDDEVYVIEANPRASRTTPFICKAYGIPYLNIATKVMVEANALEDFTMEPNLEGYAIKEPVFSFHKFPDVNKELGPEMKSTGERIYFIKDTLDPYFRDLHKVRSMYLRR
ncbi:MAG: carbamoyl-phosphate synthase large subunit [Bacteroidota bacterium]|nr:carbamoyl-phosphate synthase large subunit [Bacteroidota bacterium]